MNQNQEQEKTLNGERRRILLIEDEVNLRDLMKFRLEEAGYEVVVASDGLLAISLARRERFNVILLDLMLPKLDGYTICRILKSNDLTRSIPIIMLTARTAPQDKERGIESGADAYLLKPVDMPSLLEKISELTTEKKKEETVGEVPQ